MSRPRRTSRPGEKKPAGHDAVVGLAGSHGQWQSQRTRRGEGGGRGLRERRTWCGRRGRGVDGYGGVDGLKEGRSSVKDEVGSGVEGGKGERKVDGIVVESAFL